MLVVVVNGSDSGSGSGSDSDSGCGSGSGSRSGIILKASSICGVPRATPYSLIQYTLANMLCPEAIHSNCCVRYFMS